MSMITLDDLTGKRILIVGYGVEGKATLRFLQQYADAATIDTTDQTDGPDYLEKQTEFDIAIRSPGVPKHLITIPYTTATNLFFSLVKGKTIGVTGTKGKSTTTTLIFAILRAAGLQTHLVGNIGTPMLSRVMEDQDPATIWVMELSSFMLDDTRFSPNIAVAVSLYPDHLDYHGSFSAYAQAKQQIVAHQRAHDSFIYNPQFPQFTQWAKDLASHTIIYDPLPDDWNHSHLIGSHNKSNIQAAITVARHIGIDDTIIKQTIAEFQALPHRMEPVGRFGGVSFYDDAISTTPESTIAALDAIPKVETILLGGKDRGYDFRPLIAKLQSLKPSVVVLFPDTGKTILGMLKDAGLQIPHLLETASMEEAVAFAYHHTPKGSACLLSTAAPSYSVWRNFEEKGDQFQYWVREYATQKNNQTTNQDITSKTETINDE